MITSENQGAQKRPKSMSASSHGYKGSHQAAAKETALSRVWTGHFSVGQVSFPAVDAFSRIGAASKESLTQRSRETSLRVLMHLYVCRPQMSSMLHAPSMQQRLGSLQTAWRHLAAARTSPPAFVGCLESCWLQRGQRCSAHGHTRRLQPVAGQLWRQLCAVSTASMRVWSLDL